MFLCADIFLCYTLLHTIIGFAYSERNCMGIEQLLPDPLGDNPGTVVTVTTSNGQEYTSDPSGLVSAAVELGGQVTSVDGQTATSQTVYSGPSH